jgi:DNA-binding winged helix-turn-helix (wHTH) protein/tetratricopeptide (TPR) repeat protein
MGQTWLMSVRWDDWELDVPARRLTGGAGIVHVEPQVFDVLAYLVAHRDRVVAKEELLDSIWGDQFVSASALTTRIKSLRQALGDDGRAQKYIRNVHGHGYQFVGALEETMAFEHNVDYGSTAAQGCSLAASIALDDEFPFVGRTDEIEQIEDLLADQSALTVLIGGEPGIGKSRLAIEVLARSARHGVVVCAGRCEEHAGRALQPVRDAVVQLARSYPSEFTKWSTGIEPQLAALIPSLIEQLGATPLGVDEYGALDVLGTLFERVASSAPTILLVDDMQWSDEPTRTFVGRMTRRLRNLPIAVVCTFRSTTPELSPHMRDWSTDQERKSRVLRVDLGLLDASAARQLVDLVAGENSGVDADELLSLTRGHGLFLTESLRDMQMGRRAGASVENLVQARLERLADDVQQLVRAGAVLGPEFSFDLAAAAAGLDRAAALAGIDGAISAGLLHETETRSRFRFSHQLVPEAIRSTMSRAAAASFHHRCVRWLSKARADDVDIAHHLLGAVPLVPFEQAVAQSRQAASRSIEQHDYDRAIRLLDQVLAAATDARVRADVLLETGWALVASGTPAVGVAYFEESAELGRRNGWPAVVVEAALGHHGRSTYRRLRDTSTLDLLAEASASLGPEPSVNKARVMAKTAVFSKFRVPLAECDRMTREALDMVSGASPLVRMEVLECRAILFTCPAGLAELELLDVELATLRAEAGVAFADAATPETSMLMRARGAELREAVRADEERMRRQPIAEWRGQLHGRSPSGHLSLVALLYAFVGDIDGARRAYEDAASIGEEFWGDATYVLHALSLVFLGALGGGWDRPCQLLDALLQLETNQHLIAPAAWAHAANGNLARARTLADALDLDSFPTHGEHILGGNTLIAAAEVALLLDDDELANAAERHLLPFEELMLGLPWAPSLAADDSLARLAARRGGHHMAERHAAQARRVYEGLAAPALLARLSN